MADKKITELDALVSPDSADVLVIVDVSENITKKITFADLASALASINFAENEIPTGAINGSNVTFDLAHTPVAGSLKLFLNGARQAAVGVDFTLVDDTITMNVAPPTNSILLADYRY